MEWHHPQISGCSSLDRRGPLKQWVRIQTRSKQWCQILGKSDLFLAHLRFEKKGDWQKKSPFYDIFLLPLAQINTEVFQLWHRTQLCCVPMTVLLLVQLPPSVITVNCCHHRLVVITSKKVILPILPSMTFHSQLWFVRCHQTHLNQLPEATTNQLGDLNFIYSFYKDSLCRHVPLEIQSPLCFN